MSFLDTIRRVKEHMNDKNRLGGDCTLMQLGVLWFIAKAGSPTMKDIAAHLRVAPPSATGVIDGMVKAKLIARLADEGDRRSVRLHVTPLGERVLDRGWKKMLLRMRKLLSTLSKEDQTRLALILSRLSTAFTE
jgi:DNA-binding MarR family transcriptional regulator